MRILFLYPYPEGLAPSQRFRFEQYVQLLETNGFEIRKQSFWPLWAWNVLYKKGYTFTKVAGFLVGFARRIMILRSAFAVDYVFVHRECTPLGPPLIEWILSRVFQRRIIYDFDDSIWLTNTSAENQLVAFIKWHSKVSSICQWSYRVSAGNTHLANYARAYNKNVIINPTTVESARLHTPRAVNRNQGIITLGWTGTHSTLRFLNLLEPVWAELVHRYGSKIRLLVIADRRPSFHWPQVDYKPWSLETEIDDLRQIDIGLMPLTIDPWTEGKCGLKALQYMALAIPAVVSPVGVNTQIIRDRETGMLCNTLDEWKESLSRLIQDSDLRKTIGDAGREHVIKHYSVESNWPNFLSLFR